MKIWQGYGSEHSANLVMIGTFREVTEATTAKQIIEQLTEQVIADVDSDRLVIGEFTDRFTDAMLTLLNEVGVHSFSPSELEQFAYDVEVKLEDSRIIITTDEIDISAFLKALIDKGARVEVYSAHVYSDTVYGRGKK